MLSKSTDLAEDRVLDAAAILRPRIRPVVVPNAASKPDAVGSCVLLGVADRVFCISAAHVLDEVIKAGGGGVFLPSGRIINFDGPLFRTELPANGKRIDDRLDVGITELTSTIDLRESRNLLTIGDLAQEEVNAPRGVYFLLGYPISRTGLKKDRAGRDVFRENLSRFFGFEASPDGFDAIGVARDTHVLIDVDRRTSPDAKRQPDGPQVRGMSGGGIWRLPPVTDRIAEDQRPKLVAVFIEDPDQRGARLLGTRIAVVVELLRLAFPELRSELPISRSLRAHVPRTEEASDPAAKLIRVVDPALFEIDQLSEL
jgi:hypothetical protein